MYRRRSESPDILRPYPGQNHSPRTSAWECRACSPKLRNTHKSERTAWKRAAATGFPLHTLPVLFQVKGSREISGPPGLAFPQPFHSIGTKVHCEREVDVAVGQQAVPQQPTVTHCNPPPPTSTLYPLAMCCAFPLFGALQAWVHAADGG